MNSATMASGPGSPALQACLAKMADAGVTGIAQAVFAHHYQQLTEGRSGIITEDSISPLTDPPRLGDVEIDDAAARDALAKTVLIKLNGGLGTSMGMVKAKSLLPVRDGKSFLDIVVQQVLSSRAHDDVPLPLLFMNSFNTSDDTMEALRQYPQLPVGDLPLEFLQSQEPKVRTDDLTPVTWPADPSLEWCPPGHGDLYPSLLSSGVLQMLVDAGFRYASVSNSDNLGSRPDPQLAGWFAATGAPYAAELCRRTPMDRKGGHLAIRNEDGQLILRDTAQTAEADMPYFTDENRHPFFHTNNLWFDLTRLLEALRERNGVLGLPMIRNVKNVDPKESSSPQVFQIESAMGAAIEVFDGAQAIVVPRSRFLPVKTTNELLLIRSDAYTLDQNGALELVGEQAPVVTLSSHYKKIDDFDQRFAQGVPSLVQAESLTVEGDWAFGCDVTATGAAHLHTHGGKVPDGATIGPDGVPG